MSKGDYQVAQDIPKDNKVGTVCNEGRVKIYGADANHKGGGEHRYAGKSGRGPTGTTNGKSKDTYGRKR